MADLLKEADDIRAGAEKTRKQFDETREKLKIGAENAWNDTLDLAKRHPGKAVGIAAGAGFLLGALAIALARSRNESASDRLRGLAGTGVDAWQRVTDGFSDAVMTLREAMDEAVSKFN